jgi:hypothetical protein
VKSGVLGVGSAELASGVTGPPRSHRGHPAHNGWPPNSPHDGWPPISPVANFSPNSRRGFARIVSMPFSMNIRAIHAKGSSRFSGNGKPRWHAQFSDALPDPWGGWPHTTHTRSSMAARRSRRRWILQRGAYRKFTRGAERALGNVVRRAARRVPLPLARSWLRPRRAAIPIRRGEKP